MLSFPLLSLLLATGCRFDEQLPETELHGKVVVPRAAATWSVLNDDGTYTDTIDPRVIGPIYLGAYSSLDTVSFEYAHPSMGPIVTADERGDAFPYGGTTVGRLDFACYKYMACKVSTGRFSDWADMLDYYKNVLGSPVLDDYGNEVTSASTFEQQCYDYFEATSIDEMAFLGEVDFKENGDGDFEAEWTMFHTEFVEGMTLWGWMDAPKIDTERLDENGSFDTCNGDYGRQASEYAVTFYEGVAYSDLLNHPSDYIKDGDWVSSGAVINAADEEVTITLDYNVGE